MTRRELAKRIDHTQVRAYATQVDITELCDEALQHQLAAVTINPAWTSFCAKRLQGKGIAINPTIGFPLGSTTAHIKVEETQETIRHGATELDMVINIGALKSGFPQFVEKEIAAVVRAAGKVPVKVIIETSYLSQEEKGLACQLALRAGAAFVKTSTGFGNGGATVEDIKLMRQVVGPNMGIKAAGGIRSYRDAMTLLEAGATRLGTSAAIKILSEMPEQPPRPRA